MTIDLHHITDWIAYWIMFWSIVNILLPPRETFKDASAKTQQRYNTMLLLVAYYGSLNIRQLTVQLYDSVSQKAPKIPAHQLDKALLNAAVQSEKVQEASERVSAAVEKAQDAVPPVKK